MTGSESAPPRHKNDQLNRKDEHQKRLNGLSIKGYIDHPNGLNWIVAVTASAVWAFALNGFLPAYQPGVVEAVSARLPTDWRRRNAERWRDPYSREIMAMVNWLVDQAQEQRIDRADEANTCGFEEDGSEIRRERPRGTDDRQGVVVVGVGPNAYVANIALIALSVVTPALHDTPIFVGPRSVRSSTWVALIQQMVDYVGFLEHDAGDGQGGVYYGPLRGQISGRFSDSSIMFWQVVGLATAEQVAGPYGVRINNRSKYRLANHMIANQHPNNGGGRYRSRGLNTSLLMSAANLLVGRWLGVDGFDPDDDTPAWPPYVTSSRGELRRTLDGYLAHIVAHWRDGRRGDLRPPAFLFAKGEPTCGDPEGMLSSFRCQHVYAFMSIAKTMSFGARAVDRVGPFDWQRELDLGLVRAFDPYSGLIGSDLDEPRPSIDERAGPVLNTAFAIVVMSRTMQWPLPIAAGEARVAGARAGCDGLTRTVRLSHGESRHPSADRRIVRYDWDFDARDGLAWHTGAEIDASTADRFEPIEVTYTAGGIYQLTLRVTDDAQPPRSTTHTLQVAIDPPGASPPVADAGGPYYTWPLADGAFASVRLVGLGSADPDVRCGDQVVDWHWDFDDDGEIDAHEPVIEGFRGDGWQVGQIRPVHLQVRDATGRTSAWAHALVHVVAAPPARGEMVEIAPARGDRLWVRYRAYADVDEDLTVTLYLDDRPIATRSLQGGGQHRAIEDAVALDVSDLADGAYTLILEIEDADGRRTRQRAPWPALVDRSPPLIRIDPNTPSGMCATEDTLRYLIDDAVDPAPAHAVTHRDFGCARLSVIEATDAAGNRTAEPHTTFRPEPPDVDVQAPPEGTLVEDAQIRWSANGPASCTTALTATLTILDREAEEGSTMPYVAGTSVRSLLPSDGGRVRFDLVAYDCQSQPYNVFSRTFTINAPPPPRSFGP